MDIIKRADFFQTIVGLRYNGYWRYKTVLGGILGIIAFLVVLATLTFFSYRYFAKTDSRLNIEIDKQWSPLPLEINSKFPFGIYIYYGKVIEDNPDIITISADHVSYELSTGLMTERPIKTRKCEKQDFPGVGSQFDQLKLNLAYCPQVDGQVIEGSLVSEVFSYIRINFDICPLKQPEGITCKTLEESLKKLNDSFPIAHMFALDTTYETTKYPDVIRKFINNINVRLTANNSKETDIYLSKDVLSVFNDALFSTYEERFEELFIERIHDKISVRGASESNLLQMNIKSSSNTSVFNLSFMRFSELLANVGGIVNSVLIFFQSLAFIHNNVDFQASIVNELFQYKRRIGVKANKEVEPSVVRFKPEDGQTETVHAIKTNVVKSSKMENLSFIFTSMDSRGTVKLSASKIKNLMLFKFFNFCSKKRREHSRALTKITTYFNESQDYLNIFKKMIEIDLIKFLVFDNHQLQLIGQFPKPNLLADKAVTEVKTFSHYFKENKGRHLKNNEEIEQLFRKQDDETIKSLNVINARPKEGLTGSIDEKLAMHFMPFII